MNYIERGFEVSNVIPDLETVSQLHFCHSVQAQRDTESSIFSKFWIPAFAGMTALMALSTVMTQSPDPESRNLRKQIKEHS